MSDVVIVSGARTPVGSFGGTLKTTPVVDLGTLVLKNTLKVLEIIFSRRWPGNKEIFLPHAAKGFSG